MKFERFLHIVPQFSYHSTAYVRGDRSALIALRDALDAAIKDGAGTAHAFCSDG